MQTSYQIGKREFVLDKNKAEAAFAAKRVINGRQTMTFNLLPLKYPWAYDLYRNMKAGQWGPMRAEIRMDQDAERWHSHDPSAGERWIVRMIVGWLATASRMPANEIQHVVRELVTAPELKLVLGRQVQDDNIRTEMLVYVIYSMGIGPHECDDLFEESGAVREMSAFLVKHAEGLNRDINLTTREHQQRLAKNLFIAGQCAKGLQLQSLFGAFFCLHRQGLYPGLAKMLNYTLRNEADHIEFFGHLFQELLLENPGLRTAEFQGELTGLMGEAVALEKSFLREGVFPEVEGLGREEPEGYVDYMAACRLRSCRLPALNRGVQNPMPWLDGLIHLRSEPTTKLKSMTLGQGCSDDEL